MTLIDLYKACCANTTDIHEHLPTLYHETIEREAQQVIELGVRGGQSTIALLAAVEVTGGQLWSCDIADPRVDANIAAHPQWTFKLGDDLQAVDEAPESCDVLFIDTSHTYTQTLAELEAYGPKVRPGGIILMHDTELLHPDDDTSGIDFPVRLAINEWLEAYPEYEFENHINNNGLGIVRIPSGN